MVQFGRDLTYVREGRADELFVGGTRFQHSFDLGRTWLRHIVGTPFEEHVDHNGIFYDVGLASVFTVTDGAGFEGLQHNITRWRWQPGNPPGCIAPDECAPGEALPVTDLAVWQTYFASLVPPSSIRSPRRVLVGTIDNGENCFDDATGTSTGVPIGGTGDVFSVVFSPVNPNVAYRLSLGGVSRISNAREARRCGTLSSSFSFTRPEGNPAGGEWSRAMLAAHPTDVNTFYTVVATHVLRGRYHPGRPRCPSSMIEPGCELIDYEATAADPAPGHDVTSIVAERRGFGARTRLIAGTADAGLFVSSTDGGSWTAWGMISPPPALVFGIERGGTRAEPLYYVATTSGLFVGNPDRSVSWARAPTPERYVISDVAVDHTQPCRVYAALGYGGTRAAHRGGIMLSTNYGRSFPYTITGAQNIGLHQGPVTDVEVDPLSPNWVYAASYGHGFWFYDWTVGGVLPGCSP